ncbi:hypothetical protein BDV96DRAFT_608084 [Lophiotrema nucula]|uniref:Uncharacterized protein n=1 Tax=Lophiotrema nucula TaxID=690887 RepID=A0A6A5YEV6_9PLEO|nr:hypothetical protein BDV96DRAFT_608084 [Lophiotrema nucula]
MTTSLPSYSTHHLDDIEKQTSASPTEVQLRDRVTDLEGQYTTLSAAVQAFKSHTNALTVDDKRLAIRVSLSMLVMAIFAVLYWGANKLFGVEKIIIILFVLTPAFFGMMLWVTGALRNCF